MVSWKPGVTIRLLSRDKSGIPPPEIRISADFLSSKKGLKKRHIESSSKQIEFGTKIPGFLREEIK
jgi:hypothetical protein